MGIMIFTDSIDDVFEIRHIVKVSKRVKGGNRFYETNDGKWYSKKEFNGNLDAVKEGDIIATRVSDGTYFVMFAKVFNKMLAFDGQEPYDYSKYIIPKSLPKGL